MCEVRNPFRWCCDLESGSLCATKKLPEIDPEALMNDFWEKD